MDRYREMPLTQGKTAIVDADDYDWLMQWSWCYSKLHKGAYRGESISPKSYKTKTVSMHRQILAAPDGVLVDHINHNRLDNRKSNLRLCTHQQNSHNRRGPISRYGFIGVFRKGKRFSARIFTGIKPKYLGVFPTAEEAARAYDEAAREMRGEFAVLNFPDLSRQPNDKPKIITRGRKPAKARSSTGFVGVSRNYKGFAASIYRDHKRTHLGTFRTPEEAARAYDAAALKMGKPTFGLNFPGGIH